MPITFTTKSYADITMLNDTGEVMLELMDFGSLMPGAIAANDVPQALSNLQKNLADKSDQKDQEDDENEDENENEEDQTSPVSMTTRAMPLLELLKSAANNDNNVSWR
jgi:Sec-independent protein translocase protein TatA